MRPPLAAQRRKVQRVERLDHMRAWKLCGQQLTRGREVGVELGDRPIAPGVVVVGVDHDLPCESVLRKLIDRVQGDRHENQLAPRGNLAHGQGARTLTELGHERFERRRPA